MWRGEAADPRLRANVTLLELLDLAPEWDRLRGRARVGLADGAADAPAGGRARAGRRGARAGSPWRTWTSTEHVSRARLRRPARARAARRGAGVRPQAVRPRPAAVARRCSSRALPDGGAAYVVRYPPQRHRRPRRGPAHGAAAQPDRASTTRCGRSPRRRWRASRTRSGCSRARWRARSARCPPTRLRLLSRPSAGLAAGDGAARRSRGRSGRPSRPAQPGSPLLAARSGEWHFDVLDVALAELKAGAKAARRLGERRLPRGRARRVPPLPRARSAWPCRRRCRSASRSACAARTTRRAATGSPAPASPARSPRPIPPCGSRPCAGSCSRRGRTRPSTRWGWWGRCSPGCPGRCSGRCRAG